MACCMALQKYTAAILLYVKEDIPMNNYFIKNNSGTYLCG